MQGRAPQLSPGELDAMAKQLGLDQSVGAGPLQTAPWNQLHARLPSLPSQTAALAPLNVEVDSLAGQMFNYRYSNMHPIAAVHMNKHLEPGVLPVYDVSPYVAA